MLPIPHNLILRTDSAPYFFYYVDEKSLIPTGISLSIKESNNDEFGNTRMFKGKTIEFIQIADKGRHILKKAIYDNQLYHSLFCP